MRLAPFFALWIVAATLTPESALARKNKKKSIAEQVSDRIDYAMVKAPVDQEVCFSPDEPCDHKLVKFIQSAEKSLDIAVFDTTHDQIVHHILLQSRRIPVRVLVDKRQAKGEHSLVRILIKSGVPVRFGRQRGIMHHKFTIVDGKMVQTGSFNYTHGASANNNENQVYLANPPVVERFKKRFEEIWGEGKSPQLKDHPGQRF